VTHTLGIPFFPRPVPHKDLPSFIQHGLDQCAALHSPSPDVSTFSVGRTRSDRYEPASTRPVLLVNGTLWTGGKNGEEIIHGGAVWMDGGVQRMVGDEDDVRKAIKEEYGDKLAHKVEEVQLDGKWVTPGIVRFLFPRISRPVSPKTITPPRPNLRPGRSPLPHRRRLGSQPPRIG
jgi:hypothetical protein